MSQESENLVAALILPLNNIWYLINYLMFFVLNFIISIKGIQSLWPLLSLAGLIMLVWFHKKKKIEATHFCFSTVLDCGIFLALCRLKKPKTKLVSQHQLQYSLDYRITTTQRDYEMHSFNTLQFVRLQGYVFEQIYLMLWPYPLICSWVSDDHWNMQL